MRKRLLLAVLALLIGAAVYQVIAAYQGYVLLSFGPYVLEASLWTLLVFAVALYLFWRLCRRVFRMLFLPGQWVNWHVGRRQQRNRTRTFQGILDYFEGNWPRAIVNLKKSARLSEVPSVNYLGAAAASYELKDFEAANVFLEQVEGNGADEFAADLLRARLLLQQGDFNRALPLVEKLHRKDIKHPTVLRLLASARKGLRDWEGLAALLPELKRYHSLSERELHTLEEEAYAEILQAFPGPEHKNVSLAELQLALDRLWDSLPRRLQTNTRLLIAYLQQLQRVDRSERAESRLRRYLGKQWDEELVGLYGEIKGNGNRQLKTAETWLIKHPESSSLLRTLARLCAREQLWGKAKAYYQQSLQLKPDPSTYLELAELLGQLSEPVASADCYRQGLVAAARH